MASIDLDLVLASCNYYPVGVDLCRRVIWFAEIGREAYRRAGFLVPKQAKMSEERYGFNLDDVLLYDLSLPIGGAPSHYIFISAFCCSTLLARLLDRVPGCLVLKEPSILGQIAMLRYRPHTDSGDKAPQNAGDDAKDERPAVIPAQAGIQGRTPACAGVTNSRDVRSEHRTVIPAEAGIQHFSPTCAGVTGTETWEQEWQTWAALGIRLLTRTFEPGQTVIVKAADTCNTMCDAILANDPRSKAVLLSVGLRTFILSVLKLEDRREWTRKRANFWHKTLALFPALNEVNAPDLDDAQKAAYIWLVTAALWGRFREQAEPERLLLRDGEEVSENPGGAIRNVTSFFGLPLEESRVGEILADPVLNHHSKFPGQAYDAAQRRNDLADWETRFCSDADRAMEWAAPVQEKLQLDGLDLGAMAGADHLELAV